MLHDLLRCPLVPRVELDAVFRQDPSGDIARNARMGAGVEKITGDVDKARRDFEKMFRTTPEEASQTILKGVKGNKRRVLIGSDARAIDSMQRLMPTAYQRIMVAGQKMMRK